MPTVGYVLLHPLSSDCIVTLPAIKLRSMEGVPALILSHELSSFASLGHQSDLCGCTCLRAAQLCFSAQNLVQTVYNAIKEGYRLLDGAADYGNEKEAGEGLKRAIDEGIVKREDICEQFSYFKCQQPA